MTNAPISLQDLRRNLYVKAKSEPSWRFWGLYVHVCQMETLCDAYELARKNNGAPGIDGVTFEAIEAQGVVGFLAQIQDELTGRTYKPLRARRQEIPKDGGKVRVPVDSCYARSCGPGCAQAHTGADLGGEFPAGVVRLSSQEDRACSGAASGDGDRTGENVGHRSGSTRLL